MNEAVRRTPRSLPRHRRASGVHARLLVVGGLATALVAVGCGGGDAAKSVPPNPLLHAPKTVETPIDVARAARDPEELLRAATRRHRDSAARLGSHRFHGTVKLTVRRGDEVVEQLHEEADLARAADGALHARYLNSHDQGREVFFAKGTLWLRPRYGKFHKRPPTDDEEGLRAADDVYAALGAHLDVVGAALAPRDGGAVTKGERPARKVLLGLGTPRPRPPQRAPEKSWRDTVKVDALEGQLVLDQATGAVLGGELRAAATFARDGQPYRLEVTVTHQVTDVGTQVAFRLPSDDLTATTPLRSREFEERDELLQGIAPPATRAASPADAKR